MTPQQDSLLTGLVSQPPGVDLSITQLFNSNDIPDEAQTATLTDLSTSLNAELKVLRERCTVIEAQIQQYRGILSPLRSFPFELLGKIFVHALEERTMDHSGRGYLLGLGLVCKRWREATLATHELWSRIEFDFGAPLPMDGSIVARKYLAWFDRAGQLPQSATAVDAAPESHWHIPRRSVFLEKFIGILPPLHHLEIRGISHYLLGEALDNMFSFNTTKETDSIEANPAKHSPSHPWKAIQSLTLDFSTDDAGMDTFAMYTIFNGLLPSSLSTLSLILSPNASIMATKIPTSLSVQLKSLKLHCWYPETFLEALQPFSTMSGAQLEVLEIGLLDEDVYRPPDTPELGPTSPNYPLTLPTTVREVTFRVRRIHSFGFLDLVRAPALVKLRVAFDSVPNQPPMWEDEARMHPEVLGDEIHAFVRDSGCLETLRALHLHSVPLTEFPLFNLLASVGHLKHLTLEGPMPGHTAMLWTEIDETNSYREFVNSPVFILPRIERVDLLRLPYDFPVDDVAVKIGRLRTVVDGDGKRIGPPTVLTVSMEKFRPQGTKDFSRPELICRILETEEDGQEGV